jgi:thiamine-phosphate pyrophosphorylase
VASKVDITPAAARALEAAQRWARLDNSAVLPAHLLQGLLLEEEGRPWLLLAQAGLDPQRVRRQEHPGDADAFALEPALHETAREVLARAHELVRTLGEECSIASEHLLLALLEVDVELRQSLEAQGLIFAQLESAVGPAHGPPIGLDEPLSLDASTDLLTVARILDANANRAREALRVMEDHCRFTLADAFLSGELKKLRHDLAAALSALPAQWLLEARDTLQDVGTTLSTPRELERATALDVVQAACKRLEEALRSLEEYGKLHSADLGQAVEALRYRSYTLERALLLTSDARARLEAARLYVLVSSSTCRHSLAATVRETAAGGAQLIQLREKNLDDRTLMERAREVRRLTRQAGVVFILNDRPDIARLCEADGVHLGQDDLPVREARRILGPQALVGVSTHNIAQLRQAILDGASYVGVGPTFPSSTKDFAELAGLDFVRQALLETALPAFVLGGVTLQTLPAALAAGAWRVAVSGAVCHAEDPRAATAALRQILSGWQRKPAEESV